MATATEAKPSAAGAVHSGVTPHLMLSDAAAAANFYKAAFGAEELNRVPTPDGTKLMHCHMLINGGSLMFHDPMPEHGHPEQPHSGYHLHLQVDDFPTWWDRAVKAGAEVAMAPQDMFWGDRWGQLRDPFGVLWGVGSPTR